MLNQLIIAAALSGAGTSGAYGVALLPGEAPYGPREPQVEVWTNRADVVLRGDRVRVYFRTEADAYVTVVHVNTDGEIRILFPARPWDNNFVRARREYEIATARYRHSFVANDYPGQGYVFAVASRDPFDFSEFATGGQWDYRFIGYEGRIVGDPYAGFMDIIDVIVPLNYADYEYDVVPYHVGRRYDYPRFVCYDCHAYAPYPVWDPYVEQCVPFAVVVYSDPYYYPLRAQPGTKVVYSRPRRLEPRYVMSRRHPTEPHVMAMGNRPTRDPSARRVATAQSVTGRDVGGVGSVPTPDARRRTGDRMVGGGQPGDGRIRGDTSDRQTSASNPPNAPNQFQNADRNSLVGETRSRTNPASQAVGVSGQGRNRPTLERRDPSRQPSTGRRTEEAKPDSTRGNEAGSRSRRRPDSTVVRDSSRRRPS